MGGVVSAFGTLGSVANMAAVGGIIQLLSSLFLVWLVLKAHRRAMVLSICLKLGTKQNRYSFKNLWGSDANQGMRFIGYALGGNGWRDDVATDLLGEYRKRGFIYDMNKRDVRAANMQDVAEYAIKEKISVKDSRGLMRAGYNKNTGDIQNKFEKWLRR